MTMSGGRLRGLDPGCLVFRGVLLGPAVLSAPTVIDQWHRHDVLPMPSAALYAHSLEHLSGVSLRLCSGNG